MKAAFPWPGRSSRRLSPAPFAQRFSLRVSHRFSHRALALFCAHIIGSALPSVASATQEDAASAQQLIVQLKPGVRRQDVSDPAWVAGERNRMLGFIQARIPALQHLRLTGNGAHVLRFDPLTAPADRRAALERLRADPDVQWAEVDRRIQVQAEGVLTGLTNVLNSSSRSWFLKTIDMEVASSNTATLWQRYHGDSSGIVAVIDTGVLPSHPSLQGHLLPGFDMIADAFIANDNQAGSSQSSREADPTDTGDGVTAVDLLNRPDCGRLKDSSWHGTFVAALIAGNPDQAQQIFPINWHGQILPVRVLGKCGGFTSDFADGIRWAAGLPVPGVPLNTRPAQVVNLSLGAVGPCSPNVEGAAIRDVLARNVMVVAAAGNSGGAISSPANCPGSIAVGAADQEGLKADYSNYGSAITLIAPGGDRAYPIWSASNSGTQGSVADTYAGKAGTSFATPLVSATISLMRTLNPALTPADIVRLLRQTARPFVTVAGNPSCAPGQQNIACNCNTALCGAGMLDTAAAVNAARPGQLLANLVGPSVVAPGGSGRLDASASFNPTPSALNWQWRVRSFTGSSAPVLTAPTAAATDVQFPAGTEAAQIELTVSNGAESHTILKNILSTQVTAAQADVLGALLNSVAGGSLPTNNDPATRPDTSSPGESANGSAGSGGGATSPGGSPSGGGGGRTSPLLLLLLATGLAMLRRTRAG